MPGELTDKVTNDTVSSNQSSAHSLFSSTTVKPALGASFQFFADITLLLQDTARVFGLIDAEERERRARAPGGRTVVEVVKSRVGKSGLWAAVDTVSALCCGGGAGRDGFTRSENES